MKFLKNMKNIGKNIAKGIKKGMEVGEKIVNTADKMTGGALRSSVAGLTGGLSEMALKHYNANKKHIKSGLDVIEGKKNVKQAFEGSKYADKYNRGLEHIRTGLSHAEKTGIMDDIKNNSQIKPLMRHSNDVKKLLGV